MAIRAKHVQNAKVEAVAAEKALIANAGDFIFTEYRGMTVAQISSLRKQLRSKQATYHVVKNNFARIAFEESGMKDAAPLLVGPTAVCYAKVDPNEVAKILVEFAKENPIKVKGAYIDKGFYDSKQIEAFSKLPSKKQLISMFMSTMKAPLQNLVFGLKAVADKKGESA